jgi:sulfur carrier protein
VIESVFEVTVNGRPRQVTAKSTLPSLLEDLKVDRRAIAVAYNGDVLPRDSYDTVQLKDGDSLEIVRMVGGG